MSQPYKQAFSAIRGLVGLCEKSTSSWPVFYRSVSTRSAGDEIIREFYGAHTLPRAIPFQFGEKEAVDAFEAWHNANYLSPGDLLTRTTEPIKQVSLPFWLFEATVDVQYRGLCGGDSNSNEWEEIPWSDRGRQHYPWTNPFMQLYASYEYRRDLVEAAKSAGMLDFSKPLTKSQAADQEAPLGNDGEMLSLDPPTLKQSIAWEFASMAIRRQELKHAEQLLGRGGRRVKDVEVRFKTVKRQSRLLYVPAFLFSYNFGEHFTANGVRKPEYFQALVGGTQGSAVAAERHFSPIKVQVAAAAGMGLVTSGAAAMGLHGQSFLSPSSFLTMLFVCTSIGLAARLSPILLRQQQEDQRLLDEEADMERFLSQGMGPSDIMDDKHESIRRTSEWRRWEEANKWAWEGDKRRRWAESLWLQQQTRRIQKKAFQEQQARAEARFQYEQQQEAKRRARWGYREQNFFAETESGGARKDFLGYYSLLGLDPDIGSSFAQPDIKRAFHEAALRWHPDRIHANDEADREKAHTQFAKVQTAYEILRSPDKRKQYDNGIDPMSRQ